MHLTKHHGLGNDFLIGFVGDVPSDAPKLASRLCHRTEGIGADGLILLSAGLRQADTKADATMTLLNADGSLAEISGNGLRCVGQALARRDGVGSGSYLVDTAAGRRAVEVRSTTGQSADVAAELGAVTAISEPEAESLVAELVSATRTGSATIGNPHVVALVDDPQRVDLREVGAAVENAVAGGVNVQFISLSPDGDDSIELTVWERGAGMTRACGSGACVAAWYANQWGLVGETVEVVMPGGRATVQLGEIVTLVGPAALICDIEVL